MMVQVRCFQSGARVTAPLPARMGMALAQRHYTGVGIDIRNLLVVCETMPNLRFEAKFRAIFARQNGCYLGRQGQSVFWATPDIEPNEGQEDQKY